MKQRKAKKSAPAKILHPIYRVSRDNNEPSLWIVAPTPEVALCRAMKIHRTKKQTDFKTVSVEYMCTVDYIPALKKPHWEI